MKPKGGGSPGGELAKQIESDFGGLSKMINEFSSAAMSQFGSGWAWLILDQKKLKVIKTSNADTPITSDQIPLLTIDVWEHAYYLDYQNRRSDYVTSFFSNLANWEFAETNFAKNI